MKHLALRFQIACRLEGCGALLRFARQHDVNPTNLLHAAAGRRPLPWRMRVSMEAYIRRQFRKHAAVLRLEDGA